MKSRLRALATAASAVVLAGGVALVAASPASAAPTTPPWQPEAGTFANGTLSFYDGSGNPITSGSITDSPFAAYIQGSVAGRAGDKIASAYFYTPNSSLAPGAWSGELIGSTTYPNASAPSALASSSLPLETGASGDLSVAGYISDIPNTDSTAGYGGVYEVRVKTTAAGVAGTSLWQVADILVSGSTWQVVYPTQTQTATTTTLTANPSSASTGDSVTLTAAVSPATAGTVQFKDGATALGSPVTVSSGTATTTTTFSTAGTHSLTADFTPTSSSFAASQGTLSYVVGAAAATPTTTALGVSPTSGPAFSPVTITATISPSAAAGTVQFLDGASNLGSVMVSSGSASLTYSLFAQGTHSLTAVFTPANTALFTGSTSAAVTFVASAATGPTPANANVQAEADPGQLTITTPYSSGSPLDIGHLTRNAASNALTTSAVFGSTSTPIQVTDTRAGDLPWTAYVQTTDFSSGGSAINGQNLGLTGLQYVETPGNALSHTTVQTFDNPAAQAVSVTDAGTLGLKGLPHKFASAAAGDGTIGLFGTLTLNAPTSTLAGTYAATLTFTVG